MTHNKILLIGLPRCGSQYISQMLGVNFRYHNLVEPFTENHDVSINFLNDRVTTCESPRFLDFKTQIKYTFSILEKLKQEERVVIKYFPHSHDDGIETNIDILNKLLELNFKPIILKRENIEEHIISFLLAKNTGVWYSKDVNFNRDKVEITNFTELPWFEQTYESYFKMIRMFGQDTSIIRYENAEEDIKRIFCVDKLNLSRSVKLNSRDPYERIVNTEQVRDIVSKSVNSVQEIKKKYEQ